LRTREELQDIWEKIVDKGFDDYNSLKPEERVWFNLEPLTTNGIFDLYTNHGAENIHETIEDLKFLGFDDIADAIIEINSFFPNGNPSKDIDERNEQMDNWTEYQSDRTQEIDGFGWDRSADLEQELLLYLNKINI
jgi:hypothetical protein